jgi:uncharacterized FlaG/YvyC family protein
MADSSISRMSDAGLDRATQIEQEKHLATSQISGERAMVTQRTDDHSERSEMKPAKSKSIVTSLSDVRLHFKVDPTTHEVTVLVLDKTTQKVIRTIPPEELAQLQQGELLELAR